MLLMAAGMFTELIPESERPEVIAHLDGQLAEALGPGTRP
jgi:hypothetical protein